MRRRGIVSGLAAALLATSLPTAAAFRLRKRAQLHEGELTLRIEIRKPTMDDREYVHTTFESGLRVLVVRDPAAKKTGFSVAVEAGSLEDPLAFQGLAHFCEHMLFLGSEKYPSTDAFSDTLALYGGQHNAYTSSEETVYYNEIGNEGLEKGLDIFAQFFISPSFDVSMVDKEIHAVDSEHKKNQPDTQRRLWHLLRSRANPLNPVHQFSTGDLETLKTEPESHGKSLVEALRTFHKDNYCASRMHLVIVSNYTIQEQLAMAHKHFDAVPTATAESCPPRPEYTQFPLYSKELGNIGRSFMVHSQGSPELWVTFPMPALKKEYKKLGEAYVWNVLSHYGPGSLKALLLKEDLSPHYSYYAENTVAGSVVFLIFSLTEKGLANTDTVLSYFFAYMSAVKSAGVNKELVHSIQSLRQVMFDYQEDKSSEYDAVSTLAGSLGSVAPEDVLTGGVLIDQPDEGLIKVVLDHLVPSNMNMALVTPKFDEAQGTSHEPYYDFNYSETAIDPTLISKLEGATGFGLAPPPVLSYVPTKLDLISESAGEDGPERLVQEPRAEGWWLGRGGVKLPKAIVNVKVGFPRSMLENIEDSVLAAMHARVVHSLLEQPADALQMCGLSFSVNSQNDGFGVTFSGFDEHMAQLMEMVLPRVKTPGPDSADAFEQARRQLLLDLSDTTKLQPYQHAMEAFEVVTIRGRFARAELLEAAKDTSKVNPEAYQKFLAQVFGQAHVKVLVTGNIDRARSKELTGTIATFLGIQAGAGSNSSGAILSEEVHLTVVKPEEPIEIRIPNPIPGDPNSATLVTYQFGVPTIADRLHLAMLGEIMDRPVFEALRTERQLGYVVFGYVAPHSSIVEVRVLVQGFREGPDVVESLVEDVVKNLTSRIEGLSVTELAARRHSLRTQLEKPPVTLGQVAGQYWGQLWNNEHCFKKKAMQLAVLDAVDKNPEAASAAPLLEAWKRAVQGEGGHRRKVVVKLFGAGGGSVAPAPAAVNSSSPAITLIDSKTVQARLKGAEYWPHEFLCE
eukprot:CAMPEP_0177230770 /NCGR_PEP_ID=MMETSP0367-20130122/42401_1 /TAXON_ID=447022 ORGANISM="Scrippsiella hangoei-like, Strain SHHI-4" /NCGR_SAMPLE_ID=MMETSP0367 /ASSEMBLY_ACC=CAM_ASM_000362 /LENGTH=1017 /DNA_ID=CAMNT_0018681241 /DNA_START=38 /DNA_END=3091 /DNA_ORIENTATION=-